MTHSPTIYVDADACPVKEEIIHIAESMHVAVLFVASYDHHLHFDTDSPLINIVQLERAFQSVDMYIANHVQPGDVVVTQDFGLAVIALGKKALAISNRGERYTTQNIDFLLAVRHLNAKKRRNGAKTKGPKSTSAEDKVRFQQTLTKILRELQENK